MNIVVVVVPCIVIAAFLWRILFWKYITRKNANKSWTLLSHKHVQDFLNSGTFVIGFLWLFTYLIFLVDGRITYFKAADPLIGLKIFLLATSLLYPTVGVTFDLRYQISKMDKEMNS